MAVISHRIISAEETGMRLDRWFRMHYPHITSAYLNKLVRTGQVRVKSGRAKINTRLQIGDDVRIPPLGNIAGPSDLRREPPKSLSKMEKDFFQNMILYEDRDLYVLNKPPGFAVQGGSNIIHHLDRLLSIIGEETGVRPLLVHRLDRDTSGVILVAKKRSIAASLGELFAARAVHKTYWALVCAVPKPPQGRISAPILKVSTPHGSRVQVADIQQEGAQEAVTYYSVIDKAPPVAAWVSLKPVTGRQHQLRAHMVFIGHAIFGDDKYAPGQIVPEGMSKSLHLHARRICFPHPKGDKTIDISAPLPEHMLKSFSLFGFDHDATDDPASV